MRDWPGRYLCVCGTEGIQGQETELVDRTRSPALCCDASIRQSRLQRKNVKSIVEGNKSTAQL